MSLDLLGHPDNFFFFFRRGSVEIVQSRTEWAVNGERLAVLAEWTLDLTQGVTEQLTVVVSLDKEASG